MTLKYFTKNYIAIYITNGVQEVLPFTIFIRFNFAKYIFVFVKTSKLTLNVPF